MARWLIMTMRNDAAYPRLATCCSTLDGKNHWSLTQQCAPTENISEAPLRLRLRRGTRQGRVTF